MSDEKKADDLVKVTLEYGDGKKDEIAGPFEYARIVLEQAEQAERGNKSTRRFEVTRVARPPRSTPKTDIVTGGIESIERRIREMEESNEDALRGFGSW